MKKKKQDNIWDLNLKDMEFDWNMDFDFNMEIWEEQDLNQETNQENEARTKQGKFTLELRGNSDKKQVDAVKARW